MKKAILGATLVALFGGVGAAVATPLTYFDGYLAPSTSAGTASWGARTFNDMRLPLTTMAFIDTDYQNFSDTPPDPFYGTYRHNMVSSAYASKVYCGRRTSGSSAVIHATCNSDYGM